MFLESGQSYGDHVERVEELRGNEPIDSTAFILLCLTEWVRPSAEIPEAKLNNVHRDILGKQKCSQPIEE